MSEASPEFVASVATEVITRALGNRAHNLGTVGTELRRRLRFLIRERTHGLGYECTLGRAENAVDSALTEYSQHRVVKKPR